MNKIYEVRLSNEVSLSVNASDEVNYSNSTVAGALTAYDLPDIIGCISPRKIALVELKDQMKKPASMELIDEELLFPRSAYSSKNVTENLKIIPYASDISTVVGWCLE